MACDKISYSTRQLAIDSIRGIHKRFSRAKKKPVHAYQCTDCQGWHITSCKAKPHLPKSVTVELHTSERNKKEDYKIIDFTKLGVTNTMARFYAVLIPLSILMVESASGFSDSRVSKETMYQVELLHAFDYNVHTETPLTLDVELPAEFVINHPALGTRSPLETLIEAKARKALLCDARGPPDSCYQKSV
jgi:hypothetical protein